MGFIRFSYLSSALILLAPAVASSQDDKSLPNHSSSSKTNKHPNVTHHHHFPFPTHPLLHSPTSTQSISPQSIGLTSPHDSPPFFSPSGQGHKSQTVIIFAAIGGVIGVIFLALFTRQAIAYSRTPRHNAALTAAGREQLVREIVGYDGTADRHRQSLPAPPPYERAPSYESCTTL